MFLNSRASGKRCGTPARLAAPADRRSPGARRCVVGDPARAPRTAWAGSQRHKPNRQFLRDPNLGHWKRSCDKTERAVSARSMLIYRPPMSLKLLLTQWHVRRAPELFSAGKDPSWRIGCNQADVDQTDGGDGDPMILFDWLLRSGQWTAEPGLQRCA